MLAGYNYRKWLRGGQVCTTYRLYDSLDQLPVGGWDFLGKRSLRFQGTLVLKEKFM